MCWGSSRTATALRATELMAKRPQRQHQLQAVVAGSSEPRQGTGLLHCELSTFRASKPPVTAHAHPHA